MSDLRQSDPTPDDRGGQNPQNEAGWKRIAKKISSRTTDLIAIALILIAGLTMGRSVIEWWNTDPNELTTLDYQGIIDSVIPPDWESGIPVEIRMGDLPVSMERRSLRGEREEVIASFADTVLTATTNAQWPSQAADEREQRLLKALSSQDPWKTAPDRSAVYFSDGPVGIYTGTRTRLQENETEQRVVVWGLTFPTGEASWAGYLFRPKQDAIPSHNTDWRELLPDGTICTLSLTSREGFALIGFEGSKSIVEFQRVLSDNLQDRQFRLQGDWHRSPSGIRGVFRHAENTRTAAVVRFRVSPQGTLRGLIQISPSQQKKEKS